jgi:hypothetical protein
MPVEVWESDYCCLLCSSKFVFRELIAVDILRCPVCHSGYVHPINRGMVVMKQFIGEMGTLN